MRKRVSLQRLVTLWVLSIGLLTGAFGLLYAYWHAKHSLRSTIGLTFLELAHQSADKVGLILEKEVEWVERLASTTDVVDAVTSGTGVAFDRPAFQRWRESQLRYFRSMVILDRQGRSVGGVISDVTRAHYNQQLWWPVVFEQRQIWVGELRSNEAGSGYWEVAVPITDRRGAVIGAIKVVIEKDQLFASVFRSRIGETGHVMLLTSRGLVLACPILPSTQHRVVQVEGRALFDAAYPISDARWLETQDDGHGKAGGIVGVAPVVLRSDIAQAGKWFILVRQDPDETYAPLTVLMRRLAAFGVLAVGIVAFLRWRLALRIVQPIRALVRRMKQFGEIAPPTMPAPMEQVGIVELDDLAASFDDLARRLAGTAGEREQYVTQLERANRELATSEEHYRMLWNHSLHIRLLVDADGQIRDLNRRGEIKLWRPAADVVGTPVLSLFAEPERPRLRRLLADTFAAGRESVAGEVIVPAPTGDLYIMDVDLVPLEKGGAVEAVMVQLTDLTEKKQLQEQLLRSERLASLSHFASMFAHDIRNPLAGIKKTLELLSDGQTVTLDRPRRWCDDMRFTVDLLLGMINDMLDVYQDSYSGLPLLTSAVSLKALADEALRPFRMEAESKGIRFLVDLEPEEIRVSVDGRRLLRVLINLVHNAVKFSPAGGTIAVQIRGEHHGSRRPGACAGSSHVTIRVMDEGPGVAEEDLPHLFDLFFKKKEAGDIRTGRGLGLHFCRLVMEAHGGGISADNRRGGGAVFSLVLPVKQDIYAGHAADR
ncbi:MAG: ATP-binding protein [Nitrospira sp.]|nr:ATP-binding protein [Nitrospira sp.]